jgi:hypothetical protein
LADGVEDIFRLHDNKRALAHPRRLPEGSKPFPRSTTVPFAAVTPSPMLIQMRSLPAKTLLLRRT